jgi:UDP-glucose 4-epimerase
MNIVVTGHLGYIGSVLTAKLRNLGHTVDGIDLKDSPSNDYDGIRRLIKSVDYPIEAIVHLGADSLLGPSVKNPLSYYDNNVTKNIKMLQSLVDLKWGGKFIFASSAAVYGNTEVSPIPEYIPKMPINPYGNTKRMMEMILEDCFNAYNFKSTSFRFFNVCGADEETGMGQASDQPHIITSMCRADAENKNFVINGDTFLTEDGTCLRDYIHVNDVCSAIIEELNIDRDGATRFNLCTGTPTSNLQLFNTFKKIADTTIDVEFGDYRPGDPSILVGDNFAYCRASNWEPKETLDSMIQSAWNHYQKGLQ